MNILYICDFKNWAFHKNALAIKKYGKHNYEIRFRGKDKYKSAFKNCKKFDLIIYSVDVRPDHLLKYLPPSDKTIVLIRSDVFKLCDKGRNKFYKDPKYLKGRIKAFMCANKDMMKRLSHHDIPSYYAPGGVDTEIFKPDNITYKPGYVRSPICRVGWAGSKRNKGRRGLGLIEQACKELGYRWIPAYREDKWRSQNEMVDYYNNDIDVFVDCDNAPGRQNGLLEAGSCGLPIVSAPYGIAPDLSSCILVERDVDSIKKGLREAWENWQKYFIEVYEEITEKWSWKLHAKKWEDILNGIVSNTKS